MNTSAAMSGQRETGRFVFEAITNEWARRQSEIENLVLNIENEKIKWRNKAPGRRKWSFELPLNSWAREGCRRPNGWTSPDHGLNIYPNPLMSADAVVTIPAHEPVVVEIKLITNVTMRKYYDEVNRDTKKLALESPFPGLQIIACLDTFDLEKSADWESDLSNIAIWATSTPLVFRRGILSQGKMLVKGWIVPRA